MAVVGGGLDPGAHEDTGPGRRTRGRTGGPVSTGHNFTAAHRPLPMLVAVVSDIHANRAALEAALAEADRRGADAVVCLGDVVGYGPDPEACVDRVRERCGVTVLGNHDAAVARDEGLAVLPKDGQEAARRHREWLSDDQRQWLAGLPLVAEGHGATYAHAAPLAPASWPRLTTFQAVQAQFGAFETPVCFVGHSHKPAVVSDALGVFTVRPGHRFLVDVGSVGQPRDRDPRLAFVVYDTGAGTAETVRVHYDVSQTIARVHERGLPARLGERLRTGE